MVPIKIVVAGFVLVFFLGSLFGVCFRKKRWLPPEKDSVDRDDNSIYIWKD